MGNKIFRKMVTIVLALALVLTSGIGVFAASSPTVGKVTNLESVGSKDCTSFNISWQKQGNADKYIVKVGSNSYEVTGTSYKATVKKGKTYDISVTPVYGDKKGAAVAATSRWAKSTKLTKATAKKKKVTLKWKKVKGAKKYAVLQYKDGAWKTVKTVKKTKATIKVSNKGTYKFKVRPIKGKYVGVRSNTKTVKVK